MESSFPNSRGIIQTIGHVLRPDKLPCYIPNDDESHLPNTGSTGMALRLHG